MFGHPWLLFGLVCNPGRVQYRSLAGLPVGRQVGKLVFFHALAVAQSGTMEQTKTYMARPDEIVPKWWLVDATDKVVGRLASDLAMLLMGKNRPTYTPHIDNGNYVIVINAEKVVLTGEEVGAEAVRVVYGPSRPTYRDGRPPPQAPPGANPPRGRSADAAEEQAGLQDARQAEDLQRQRASAPGPRTGTHRTGDQGLETDMVVVKSNDILGTGRRKTSVARVRLRPATARFASTAGTWRSISTTSASETPCWRRWSRPASGPSST